MQTLIVLCGGLCSVYSGSAHMHIISIELSEIGLLQRINERGLAIFSKFIWLVASRGDGASWPRAVSTVKSTVEASHPFGVDAERILFSLLNYLIVLSNIISPSMCWPISGLPLPFHCTICLSFHQFHTILFFLLKITSAILDPLPFHINFRISTSISTYVKKKKKKKRKKVKKWKPVSLLGSWLKLCSFNRLSIGE